MLTRSQLTTIAAATVVPFLVFAVLMMLSPGYMTYYFEPGQAACSGPMLLIIVICQILVAVLLTMNYRAQNDPDKKKTDAPPTGAAARAGTCGIVALCMALTLVSLWLVVLGPAMLQLLSPANSGAF